MPNHNSTRKDTNNCTTKKNHPKRIPLSTDGLPAYAIKMVKKLHVLQRVGAGLGTGLGADLGAVFAEVQSSLVPGWLEHLGQG